MAVVKLVERAFPWAVLSLTVISTYFVTRGISALAEHPLGVGLAQSSREALNASFVTIEPERTARDVAERNPFDSKRSCLLTPAPAPAAAKKLADPLTAPACPDVHVSSTLIAADPLASSAVVRAPGESIGRVLGVGAAVGDWRIAFIGQNPLNGSPAIWLENESGLCQSALFGAAPRDSARDATVPAVARVNTTAEAPSSSPVSLSELASSIRRRGAGSFELTRRAVSSIMAHHAQLLRGSRMVPDWQDGALVGFKVDRIAPDTLLGVLGFESGDRIEAINDHAITSPERALQAYTDLRAADQLKVRVNRGGRSMVIEYSVR